MGLVTRSGAQFTLDGAPFRFVGFNCYQLTKQNISRAQQDQWLAEMRSLGVSVVRTWCFGETTAGSPPSNDFLQFGNVGGQWNEAAFVILDNAIAAAAKANMKLILCLSGNWSDFGGKGVYATWWNNANATALVADDFHANAGPISLFKTFISKVLTRANTVTGIPYNADHAIMAWELINEGRYTSGTDLNPNTLSSTRIGVMNAWITNIAAYIKSLDSLHLVGSGGIFQAFDFIASDPVHNGSLYGLDFLTQHQLANVDFCDFHLYPGANFVSSGADCTLIWPSAGAYHAALTQFSSWAATAGKPLVIGEVGLDRRNSVTSPIAFNPRGAFLRGLFGEMLGNGVNGILLWNYRQDGTFGYLSGWPGGGQAGVPGGNQTDDDVFVAVSDLADQFERERAVALGWTRLVAGEAPIGGGNPTDLNGPGAGPLGRARSNRFRWAP